MKISELENEIELLSKTLTLLFKIGVLMGASCLFVYNIKIKYIPTNVSLGDGVYFILIASCFSLIYGIFLSSIVGLGLCLSWPINFLLKIYNGIRKRFKPEYEPINIEFPTFSVGALVWATISIPFIVWLASSKADTLWLIPSFAILCLVSIAVFNYNLKEIQSLKIQIDTNIVTEMTPKESLHKTLAWREKAIYYIIIFPAVIPLLMGGFSGVIIDGTMRLAQLRKDNAIIYVSKPYSELIPSKYKTNEEPKIENYSHFKNLNVLFKGIGTKTVISYNIKEKEKTLIIPNKYIIII